jgi:hypothetical protein
MAAEPQTVDDKQVNQELTDRQRKTLFLKRRY